MKTFIGESNNNSNVIVKGSPDLKTHHDAAEVDKLLRRKNELEIKQKMDEKYNERLQVSLKFKSIMNKNTIEVLNQSCWVQQLVHK